MAGKRKPEHRPGAQPRCTSTRKATAPRTPLRPCEARSSSTTRTSGRKRRTWFFLEEVEIKWLPVSESAFLLWVLLALLLVWMLIGSRARTDLGVRGRGAGVAREAVIR